MSEGRRASLKTSMARELVVIGHPAHRRVRQFCQEAIDRGFPEPTVIAHRDLLQDPESILRLDERPRFVRIEAFGEDVEVERLLLALGYVDAQEHGTWAIPPDEVHRRDLAFGEVVAPRQSAFGQRLHLERLDVLLSERPAWRVLQPPRSIVDLFDKQVCWRRHLCAGVPVPEAMEDVLNAEQLHEAMDARQWRWAYVKLVCGSSASCLALYDRAQGVLTTTLVEVEGRWFNSLRLRRYREPSRIELILDFLIREGVQIERGLLKARREGRYFDLRVVVIGGEPAFVVERRSPSPVTNLHLGGARGDPEAVRALIGTQAWAAMEKTAQTVAAIHGCFHLGVDIAILRDRAHHSVIEANAFGDFLPGLARDGLSVYGWQLERLPTLGRAR